VLAGDAAEVARRLEQGAPLRVLAVLAPQRLGGLVAAVPTAREQGVDLVWPILRGVYVARDLPEADRLARQLEVARQRPDWAAQVQRLGLAVPAVSSAAEVPAQVREEVARLRQALEQLRRPPEAR
ncbi:type 2 periplasmic-binding domain-containing protein, partial [Sphaerotilus sulfidivorans]